MRLEAKKCLYDIQQAADLLAQFTAGKMFSDYQREPMLRLAVERGLTIIGKALSKLDAALAARISDHRNIIAFRNILVHAYAEVDDLIVWGIVETELPDSGKRPPICCTKPRSGRSEGDHGCVDSG
jgi:uncharacterized protein with HEPN domain